LLLLLLLLLPPLSHCWISLRSNTTLLADLGTLSMERRFPDKSSRTTATVSASDELVGGVEFCKPAEDDKEEEERVEDNEVLISDASEKSL